MWQFVLLDRRNNKYWHWKQRKHLPMPISLPVPLAKAQGQSIVHPQSGVRVTFLESCTTQRPWKKNNPLAVLANGRTQYKALPCFLRAGHIQAASISIFQIVSVTHTHLLEPVLTPGLGASTGESAEERLLWSQTRDTALQWHEIKGTYQESVIWRAHAWHSTGESWGKFVEN